MKRFLRDKLPRPETITDNKYLGFLRPYLGHPRLWHLHRRGVALGVSIGLVAGLIPGPVQILLAVLIAIPLRANLMVSAATTFYTNPLTFVPLYMAAYGIGSLVTGAPVTNLIPPELGFSWSEFWGFAPNLFRWFIALGDTLLIGLAIQATLFALSGYLLTMIAWRCVVSRMWVRRARARG